MIIENMKRFLMLLLFCKANFSAIYKEQQNVPKGDIVYTGEEPSKLACIQKSFFYKAEAVYDGRLCTCVKKVVEGVAAEENGIEGTAYSLVGDMNLKKLKYEIPVLESCKEIAEREPSASSGLYTIRYNATKTIQVYCNMDRNLKVLTENGAKPVGAGWMLVANVSFAKTISTDEAKKITDPVSTNVDELKNAATENFLFDMSQLLKFTTTFKRIRIYCKRERILHFLGSQKVVNYFMAKNNTCPASCGTFKRFVDDNSRLGGQCEKWARDKWGCESSGPRRMYYWPFYVPYGATFTLSGSRIECDDRKTLGAGTWQVFVK